MSIGLIGKKQGMTRVFTPEGDSFAVSVVSVLPNTITQIKSVESEGYSSIQVTTGEKKEKHLSKACLLYTSPSPRDATLSRMPSSA